MQERELIALVNDICQKKSEGQSIEVKAAYGGCPSRLYDTISSFSNQDNGGIIIFGIDETKDYAIVGVYDLQDLQKNVTEQCNQMEPPVRALFSSAIINGHVICSLEIPGLDYAERPCYYKGKGIVKGSYIRVGDADLPMTDYEVYSFEAFRKHLYDDERPVERASLDLMDDSLLQRYILKRKIDRPGFSMLKEEQVLEMMNITRNGKLTLAAVMNFCVYPQGFFPQLAITAVVVPGTEMGVIGNNDQRFLDNKRIEGTIKTMLEEAVSFSTRNMKVQTIIDSETGMRNDRTEYPIKAIREAVLNALIHRDYSPMTEGTPIQMIFFSDRLEIHSPGNLYGRMTIEELGFARPDLRNPALAVMAENLAGAENRYSGIPTIRLELRKNNLPEPIFENRRNEFVVTFYNSFKQNDTFIEHNGTDLVAFCRIPRSRKEISDYLGLKTSSYAMEKFINPLIDKGVLDMTIPDKPKSTHQRFVVKKKLNE